MLVVVVIVFIFLFFVSAANLPLSLRKRLLSFEFTEKNAAELVMNSTAKVKNIKISFFEFFFIISKKRNRPP